jgi:hypothetical protein
MNATTLQARYFSATLALTLQRYSRLYRKARCCSVVAALAALLAINAHPKTGDTLVFSRLAPKSRPQGLAGPAATIPAPMFNDQITGKVA